MLDAMIVELQELPKDLQTNLDRGKVKKTVIDVLKCSFDLMGDYDAFKTGLTTRIPHTISPNGRRGRMRSTEV